MRATPNTQMTYEEGKGFKVAVGTQNPTPDSQVYADIETVTINVFFDGTLNNIYNANPNSPATKQSSYDNDYSNVGRMYLSVAEQRSPKVRNIYIEGMGTKRQQADDQDGYALGTGSTGIKMRAQEAIQQITDFLYRSHDPLKVRALINVFGFSRGAATARHFIHQINTIPYAFESMTFPEKRNGLFRYNVGFVGLFDTVSSFAHDQKEVMSQSASFTGIQKEAPFTDDVQQLGLKFNQNDAARVFHLVAGDEFRINFSLTDIQSAIDLNIGYEVQIPGAHSDIGGGYINDRPEYRDIYSKNLDFDLTKHLHWWGWFKETETNKQRRTSGGRQMSEMHYHMWRGNVYNRYYRVTLRVMLEMVKRYTSIQFPKKDIINYAIEGSTDPWNSLRYLSNEVSQHVLNHAPKKGERQGVRAPAFKMKYNTDSDCDYSRRIYRNFIHYSSDDSMASGLTAHLLDIRPNQPRIGADGRPYRRIFKG
mgnify:CR=1 FL=1